MKHGAWSPSILTNVFDGTAVTGEKMALNRTGLMMAAMMALSGTALADAPPTRRQERELTPEEKEAQMRRELADCQAHKARLAAAAEKRARKATKRIKDMPSNAGGKRHE